METWSHNLSQTNMSHKLMNLMLEKENSVVKKYSENYEEENILECFGHFLSHLLDNVKKLWKSNIKKILVPFNHTFVSTFFSFPSLFDSLIHQIGIWKEMETHKTNVSCLPQTKPQWMEWMDVCTELSHEKIRSSIFSQMLFLGFLIWCFAIEKLWKIPKTLWTLKHCHLKAINHLVKLHPVLSLIPSLVITLMALSP